jgi:hypothetical protein
MSTPGPGSSADAAASVAAQVYEDRFPCGEDGVPDEFRRIAPEQLGRGDLAFTHVPLYDPGVPEIAKNNTLFEALSVHLFESPVFHKEVRTLVAVWMLGCIEWTQKALRKYRGGAEEVTQRAAITYVCDMRDSDTPGTPIEMAAAAMAFGAHIPVYEKRDPDADGSDARIVLAFAIWPCYVVPPMAELNVWPLVIFAQGDVYGALRIKGRARESMLERMLLPAGLEDDEEDDDEGELPDASAPTEERDGPSGADADDADDADDASDGDGGDGGDDASDGDGGDGLGPVPDLDPSGRKSSRKWNVDPLSVPTALRDAGAGVDASVRSPRHPLSGWRLKGDRRLFLGRPLDVERVATPLSNGDEPCMLVDPPMQYADFDGADVGAAAAQEIGADSTEALLLQQRCSVKLPGEQRSARLAPSFFATKQDVNTVEIVKRDGNYSVLIDGVSQGVIKWNEDAQEWDSASYWMPRFKEQRVEDPDAPPSDKGTDRKRRVVQPVLVAMRLEDYEEPPDVCTLEVRQRAVHDGTEIMPPTTVKQERVRPYSVGDATCNATVVPYPLACTPEPYVMINDYSQVRHYEALYLQYYDESLWKLIRELSATIFSVATPAALQVLGSAAAAYYLGKPAALAAASSPSLSAASSLSGWIGVMGTGWLAPLLVAGVAGFRQRKKILSTASHLAHIVSQWRGALPTAAAAAGGAAATGVAGMALESVVGQAWANVFSRAADLVISTLATAIDEGVDFSMQTLAAALPEMYKQTQEEDIAMRERWGPDGWGGMYAQMSSVGGIISLMKQAATGVQDAAFVERARPLAERHAELLASKTLAKDGIATAFANTLGWMQPVANRLKDAASFAGNNSPALGKAAVYIGGMSAAMFLRYVIRDAHGAYKGEYRPTSQERAQMLAGHRSEMAKGPKQHKITLQELPRVLRRIAETRANGSLMDGSDQTVGMSVHDLDDFGWRTEAALLEWLAWGDGPRAEQGADDEKPDPITGRYSIQQDIKQAATLKDYPGRFKITNNTISVAGMDPLTLSNSRTEFSYRIKIVERDGRAGPTIYIAAPRMNGIDAGWVAAGHDEHLRRAMDAAACLRQRLTALEPAEMSIHAWIANHSTLVKDTNNGAIAGDRYDKATIARMAAADPLLSDAGDPDADRQYKKAKSILQSDKQLAAAQRAMEAQRKGLSDRREAVDKQKKRRRDAAKKLQDRMDAITRAKDRAVDKARQALDNAQNRMNNANTQAQRAAAQRAIDRANERIQNARNLEVRQRRDAQRRYDDGDTKSASNLATLLGKVRSASRMLRRARATYNWRRVEHSAIKRDPRTVSVAAIYDYAAIHERLTSGILGDFTEEAVRERATGEPERVEKMLASRQKWYRRWLRMPADQEVLAQAVRHREWCRDAVCLTLAVSWERMFDDDVMLLRFMDTYSPPSYDSKERNRASMRMGTFVVPPPEAWDTGVAEHQQQLVRVMPQIIEFPNHTVATFGSATVLRPAAIRATDEGVDDTMAKQSVSVARHALQRMTLCLDMSKQRVWGGECHLVQVYQGRPEWRRGASDAFWGVARDEYRPVDMLASAALPSRNLAIRLGAARAAGGNSYAAVEQVAAGRRPEGAARLLQQLGLALEVGSLHVLGTFAELLSFFTLVHSGDGGCSGDALVYAMHRGELLQSSLSRARSAAVAVAQMLLRHYSKPEVRPRRLRPRDTAFYCLPNMPFLQVAMRRLGLFDSRRAWGLNDAADTTTFARQLERLARSSSLPLRALPFSCLTSVLAPLPAALAQVAGNRNPLEVHVAALVHSFGRVRVLTAAMRTPGSAAEARGAAAVCVDCAFAKPIVLKALQIDGAGTTALMARAAEQNPQLAWDDCPHKPALPISLLRPRLARLRVDVDDQVLEERAIDPRALRGASGAKEAYAALLERTERLSIARLDVVDADRKTATFVVPFGLYRSGTPADLAHMHFEQHPVWVECLERAADTLALDGTLPESAGPHAPTQLVADAAYMHGRPRHPYALLAGGGRVNVYLDTPGRLQDAQTAVASIHTVSDAAVAAALELPLPAFADALNAHSAVVCLSGEMAQTYRAVMHNAERIFQANALVATREYTDPADPDLTCVLSSAILDRALQERRTAACVCIGNALAAAETHSLARVRLQGAGEWATQAAQKLRVACAELRRRRVKAVPFSELCMAVAVM